jgi:shikimate dehydrogenase
LGLGLRFDLRFDARFDARPERGEGHMLRCGLLGYPIDHSLSPAIHNAAYRELGLDWAYALYPCRDEAAFLALIAEAQRADAHSAFVGFNVTTPYKRAAYAAASRHSFYAEAAGNANVLTFSRETAAGEGAGAAREAAHEAAREAAAPAVREATALAAGPTLKGDNTDGRGLLAALRRAAGVDVAGASVVLCGTGSVAMATLLSLIEQRAGRVSVVSRNPEKGAGQVARLRESFASKGAGEAADGADKSACEGAIRPSRPSAAPPAIQVIGASEVAAHLETADILIDATSLGMNPGDEPVVSPALLRPGLVVLDVVYGHGQTALIREARARGARAFDGLGMLVEQAALTMEIWAREQGCPLKAPRDLMYRVALSPKGASR